MHLHQIAITQAVAQVPAHNRTMISLPKCQPLTNSSRLCVFFLSPWPQKS